MYKLKQLFVLWNIIMINIEVRPIKTIKIEYNLQKAALKVRPRRIKPQLSWRRCFHQWAVRQRPEEYRGFRFIAFIPWIMGRIPRKLTELMHFRVSRVYYIRSNFLQQICSRIFCKISSLHASKFSKLNGWETFGHKTSWLYLKNPPGKLMELTQ